MLWWVGRGSVKYHYPFLIKNKIMNYIYLTITALILIYVSGQIIFGAFDRYSSDLRQGSTFLMIILGLGLLLFSAILPVGIKGEISIGVNKSCDY